MEAHPERGVAQVAEHIEQRLERGAEEEVDELTGKPGETEAGNYDGSVTKFDFWGKIQKSGVRNSISYRLQNSRKSNFATEPSHQQQLVKK